MAIFPFSAIKTGAAKKRPSVAARSSSAEPASGVRGLVENLGDAIATLRLRFENLAESNYALAHYHLRAGNDFDAVMRFRITIRRRPSDAAAQFYLARLYLRSSKEKNRAQGIEMLKRLSGGGAMAGESKYALAVETPGEQKPLPRRVPFRLMCDAEQNITQFKDETLGRYLNIEALCLPETQEETDEDGETLRPAQPRASLLYYGVETERKYAAHLINLLTESCAAPLNRLLLLGDRYGYALRYVKEKDAFPEREQAMLPRFVPLMPDSRADLLPKRVEKGAELQSFPDAKLNAMAPAEAVLCPYWGMYFGKPSDLLGGLGCLREGGLAAFGVLENSNDESGPATHYPIADVFTHNLDFVRKDMEEAGFEYIAMRPFTSNGRRMRRQLCVFRKIRGAAA